jgi:hypothetical protein
MQWLHACTTVLRVLSMVCLFIAPFKRPHLYLYPGSIYSATAKPQVVYGTIYIVVKLQNNREKRCIS